MLSVADALENTPERISNVKRNLQMFLANDSPVARTVGKRWRRILGSRSPEEIVELLRLSFGSESPSVRRSEFLDLLASTHPFAGVVPEGHYRQILAEEFTF